MDDEKTLKTEPVDGDKKSGKKKAATKQTHKKECGDVGETGEHGDLGTNAAE